MLMLRRSGGTTLPGAETRFPFTRISPRIGLEEAREHAQRRRLAAARRAEQADELALFHRRSTPSTEAMPL